MAKEVEVNYFDVTVKVTRETDEEDKAGNPKTKSWPEKWIVHAKTSDEANKIVSNYYDGTMDEWRITGLKETKYLGILNEN